MMFLSKSSAEDASKSNELKDSYVLKDGTVLRDSNVSKGIEERGSIETGLVFIPTTLLFLLVLQFIITGSWQTIADTQLDSYVTRVAMSGEGSLAAHVDTGNYLEPRQEVFSNAGGRLRISEEPLPFDGRIVVGEAVTKAPIVSSFLGDLFRTRSVSISVK